MQSCTACTCARTRWVGATARLCVSHINALQACCSNAVHEAVELLRACNAMGATRAARLMSVHRWRPAREWPGGGGRRVAAGWGHVSLACACVYLSLACNAMLMSSCSRLDTAPAISRALAATSPSAAVLSVVSPPSGSNATSTCGAGRWGGQVHPEHRWGGQVHPERRACRCLAYRPADRHAWPVT